MTSLGECSLIKSLSSIKILASKNPGTQSVNLWWMAHQSDINRVTPEDWPALSVCFPLYVAQSALATSLIVYEIWSCRQQTKAAGLVALNTPNLLSIMRMIVESVAIYTIQLVVAFVLVVLDHPAAFFVNYILAPLTGEHNTSMYKFIKLNLLRHCFCSINSSCACVGGRFKECTSINLSLTLLAH